MSRYVQGAILLLSFGISLAKISNKTFPTSFSFGASTAAYQIEGAWNANEKGETIWDHYVHTNPSRIVDGATGDVACDSYHKYKEDVEMIAKLGLQHYRFSISWSRILPTGFKNEVNLQAVLYYQNLIRELEQKNITPMVTMYHWDLPESIQDVGGWTDSTIVGYFKDYAEILFEYFPSIRYWITINEPKQVCVGGYGKASKAPGLNSSGIADYLCTYNVLKAHAAVYHLYQEKFAKLGAKISMSLDAIWNIPTSDSEVDKASAERRLQFELGIFAHPLIFGDWPEIVKERVAYRSKYEGYPRSRLPNITDEDRASMINTLDFFALNFYNTNLVADAKEGDNTTSLNNDIRINATLDGNWSIGVGGITIYPSGLRSMLEWLKDTYNVTEVIITENGIADDGSSLDDYNRIYYLADYLSAVLDSIHVDNVNVAGYTMWSLMDNFEWNQGYSLHFGLYAVNFTDPDRTRTPKKSVDYYNELIKNRAIPELPETSPEPPTTPSTTPSTLSTEKPTGEPTGGSTSTQTSTTHKGRGHSHIIEPFLVILTVALCVLLPNY